MRATQAALIEDTKDSKTQTVDSEGSCRPEPAGRDSQLTGPRVETRRLMIKCLETGIFNGIHRPPAWPPNA